MKHAHSLLPLIMCIISTTSNAMLIPRFTALLSRTLSHGPAQSIARFSTTEDPHIPNAIDPKNMIHLDESCINCYAEAACSAKKVPKLLSYALHFAISHPESEVEHKYAQLIDRTLQYATDDKRDYVNTQLWNENKVLWSSYGYGAFPLHEAVYYNLAHITQVLLQHKANVSLPDHGGRTALHWVNKPEIARTLIKNGAPINAQDEEGNSPLHLARSAIIPILLEHGADIALKNNKKTTLLAYAYYYRNYGFTKGDPAKHALIDEQLALIEAYVNNNAISADDKKDLAHALVDMDRGDHLLEWRFNGITPLMRTLLLHSDNERLEAFLTYAAPTAIAKQLNPLQLVASCEAVKSEENKIFVRMLDEYKKKHNF